MERLIAETAAYQIFSGDKRSDRLSHAYMLYFPDGDNLRGALRFFARAFFGCAKDDRVGRLVASEAFADLKVYPKSDGKLTADAAAEIVEDAALCPVEGDKKLYIVGAFESASPIFQNKLLKILEEPPQGVYFLLGATSLSPVLETVKSRVKLLEIPPFTQEQIYCALERKGRNPANAAAARSCGGILGVAERMVQNGRYAEVRAAAEEICRAATVGQAVRAAVKYGDFKDKTELLSEMQQTYFRELEKYARDGEYEGVLSKGAVIYAVESVNKAFADVKFNANFASLLYDFALRVATENQKWLK